MQPNIDGADIKGDHGIIVIGREAKIESTSSKEILSPVLTVPTPTVESGIETAHKNLEDALGM